MLTFLLFLLAMGLSTVHTAGDDDLTPLTIAVVDDLGAPVTAFDYYIIVESASGYRSGAWNEWTSIENERGELVVSAPASCQVHVAVRTLEHLYDYPGPTAYDIRGSDELRSIVHRITRGAVLRGRVIDAKTGEPVADARVSPQRFMPPLFVADRERSVRTDANGSFVLRCARSMIVIEHDRYPEAVESIREGFRLAPPGTIVDRDFQLDPGLIIHGAVRDRSGAAVDGAQIWCGAKRAMTDAAGFFTVEGVEWTRAGDYPKYMTFDVSHPDFEDSRISIKEIADERLAITLVPLLSIRGHVRTTDGAPVRAYRIIAGPTSYPQSYECTKLDIDDAEGAFEIRIEQQEADELWIAVRAEGFAFKDMTFPVEAAHDLQIVLDEGVVISGTLIGRPSPFVGTVVLTPERAKPTDRFAGYHPAAAAHGKLSANVEADGKFRIPLVQPDCYRLLLRGENFTGCWLLIRPDGLAPTVQLEPIEVVGMGRIEGRVHTVDGAPWAFADGQWWDMFSLSDEFFTVGFKADENGRFVLEDVPAGSVTVSFEYNMSADVIGMYSDTVTVVPGETARAVVNDPDGADGIEIRVNIEVEGNAPGAASSQAPVARLTAMDDPAAIPIRPRGRADDLRFEGVDRGAYLFTIHQFMWQRWNDGGALLYETEIMVADDTQSIAATIPGGAVTGSVNSGRRDGDYSPIGVYARSDASHAVYTGRTEDQDHFVLSFMPPGSWTFYARHEDYGWGQSDEVTVAKVTNCGVIELQLGGSVHIEFAIPDACVVPTRLRAESDNGVGFDVGGRVQTVAPSRLVRHLWPGDWRFIVLSDDEELGSAACTIHGTERVELTMVLGHTRP